MVARVLTRHAMACLRIECDGPKRDLRPALAGPGSAGAGALEGGENPAWNPSGRELFFTSRLDAAGRWRMWAVDMETSPRLRIGTPRSLFDFSADLSFVCVQVRCHAVSPDGGRFFGVQLLPVPPTPPVTHVRLVQGWLEEMKARLSGEVSR